MKLAIINGSPRNKKSNSKILVEKFLDGYYSVIDEEVKLSYIADFSKRDECIEAFKKSDTILIIFPLYTDSMPGIVKEFLEQIAEEDDYKNKKIGWIVQSGFPEAIHSDYVKRYLVKFTDKHLQSECIGILSKGGVEGIQIMPEKMTQKLFARFCTLGEHFARTGKFSEALVADLEKPYKASTLRLILFKIFSFTGLANFYWNSNLKKNKAYHLRFDRPFHEA